MSLLTSTNAAYHADKTCLSSTGLKLLLADPARFYEENVLGKRVEEESNKFDEGSFTHSLILEPEKVATDYAIFTGMRKQGAAWEDFKAANVGKKLLSAPQVNRCEALLRAYQALPAALEIMNYTLSEHTMMSTIVDIPVKARADAINVEGRYIVDVKTTAMPSDIECFKATVEQYSYQLSAALYAKIASDTYGHPFDFYWLVLSKADNGCEIYKASAATMSQGNALVAAALALYKKCTASGKWTNEKPLSTFERLKYEIQEV